MNIDTLLDELFSKGGFSADLLHGRIITTGYAVSAQKDRECKTALSFGCDSKPQSAITAIAAYTIENFALLATPGNVLGAWLDESNTLWLDISVIVDHESLARRIAEDNNQVAYFDFQTKTVVYLEQKQ